MAKISLRVYNREIEGLIDNGEIVEAIAHCQHILKTFPKHLETYRMLGKAYLESQRYNEAADIFQRVLMSTPDDFVSHVGMSIIRDDEKKSEQAIWHMERAFEAQPSNAAVQGELRRLYGQRDGMEPPKIRMTRGALAHMYLQGQLYPQAIAEIRAVLAEQPERVDMQVLLARAYFNAGQRVDATDSCSRLLKKYPYSLDANKIMVEILPGTGRAESTQVYRHKVNQLDPYAAFVSGSIFTSDTVPDGAVTLERLQYEPGMVEDMPPAWANDLGIKLQDTKDESPPDWITNTAIESESDQKAVAAQPEPEAEALPSEDIPDWLRDAGWTESTGDFQEEQVDFSEDEASEDIVEISPAAIPDWLQAIAPEDAADEKSEELPEDDVSDFLSDLGLAAAPAAAFSAVNENQPDWGEEHSPETPSEEIDELPAWFTSEEKNVTPSEELPLEEGDFPDWLQDQADTSSSAEKEETEFPDWMQSAQVLENKTDEDQPEAVEELEWMNQVADEFVQIEATEEEPQAISADLQPERSTSDDLGRSAADQDAAMAWLESLAAKHGAKEEELVLSSQDERSDTPPDWVERSMAPGDESAGTEFIEETTLEPQAAQEETLPEPVFDETFDGFEWLEDEKTIEQQTFQEPVAEPSADLGRSATDQDAAMAWLESLAAKHGAKEEELVLSSQDERSDTPPDWVEKSRQADISESEMITEPEIEPEIFPEPLPEEETTPDVLADDEQVGWLAAAEAQPEPASEETPAPDWSAFETGQPVADIPEMPEWMKSKSDEVEAVAQPERDSELDIDWAADFGEEQPEEEPFAARSDWMDAISDEPDATVATWLKSLNEEKAREAQEKIEPTEPVAETQPDLPEWLVDDADQKVTTTATADSAEEIPDWLLDEFHQEKQPTQISPTTPADWQPIPEEEAQEEVEPVSQAIAEPEEQPEPVRQEKLSSAATEDTTLLEAQTELQRGNLDAALKVYEKMIKKGRLLDEIIYDLREATYRYPVDVKIWQALGDAYMRANRLQDALDAYTKAEELLR